MRQRPPVDYQFQNKGKFALLTFNNIYVDLPPAAFRLSDGTWVMPGVPVSDLGIWKEWIGSIRMERLEKANLVLFVEEPSSNPEILDAVHKRLGDDLSRMFYLVHLRSGRESAVLRARHQAARRVRGRFAGSKRTSTRLLSACAIRWSIVSECPS